MPIKIVSVYATSDGETFTSEKEAKEHELCALLLKCGLVDGNPLVRIAKEIVTQWNLISELMDAKPDAPPKRKPRSDRGKNHAKRNSDKAGHRAAVENRELQDMKQ